MSDDDNKNEKNEDVVNSNKENIDADENEQKNKRIRLHNDFAGESFCCGSPPTPLTPDRSRRLKYMCITLAIFLLIVLFFYFKYFPGQP